MSRLFGTDGIRGIANTELNCDMAFKTGFAAASLLKKGNSPSIVIGCDTRASSDMLCAAIAAGICSAGANAEIIGVVPTPAVAYLTKFFGADAGIMVSASHNSFEYNGIKIFDGEGFKLPDELEDEIEKFIIGTKNLPQSRETGRILHRTDSISLYLDHIKSTTDASFKGLNIAIDCANGSASVSAKELFGAFEYEYR